MGTPDGERSDLARRYGGTRESYAEEAPQSQIVVAGFAIAATPITHALYFAFTATTGARPPVVWHGARPPVEMGNHPVVDVTWDEAQAFCRWLSREAGRTLRLPSEAEWEKAARGTDGRRFPWGDEWNPEAANTRESGIGSTTPVGGNHAWASPYGVLDVAGNVWEWTQSLQAAYPYREDGRNDSHTGRKGVLARLRRQQIVEQRRVLRGGCYANPQGFARCACRFRLLPGSHTPFLGFRLATDLV
ncbi:MAG: formylglycine-generating enzyme family protein [Herpetosiphon sp.]